MASQTQEVRAAVEGRLSDNITSIDAAWTAADNVAWAGTDFDPPADNWIRPSVLFADGIQESGTDAGVNTIEGVVEFQLFSRPGSGYGTLYDYADAVRDLFDRVQLVAETVGPNLITNGTFDDDASEWTLGGGWVYLGDPSDLINSPGSPGGVASTSVSIDAHRIYRLGFTVSNYALSSLDVTLGGAAGTSRSADGTYSEDIKAGSADTLLAFDAQSSGPFFVGSLDDITLSLVTTTTLNLLAASGPLVVETDDTTWLQMNVTVPFIVEENS